MPEETKSTKAVKLRVTDIVWLNEEGDKGESPAATLSRLREELIAFREGRDIADVKDPRRPTCSISVTIDTFM